VLSVVCPVYNEADNITRVFDELRTKASVPMEVLIVYDREEDNTLPVVRAVAARYPFAVRPVRNRFDAGALNAIKTGFRESQGDAVLVVMADLSDDLSRVDEMYSLVTGAGFAIVNGSRYAPGGRQIGGPFLKRLLSRLAGVSLHYLVKLPTHDVTNSFKMYRREFLQGITVESTGGFEIGMELVVKAFVNGDRITELPTTWTDRTAGQSRFRLWKWLPHYLRWYFYAFRKLRVRKSLTEV
jgi:dolichol-phosphate mannosyltransferase